MVKSPSDSADIGDDFDLTLETQGQLLHRDAGAGGLGREILCVDGVERCKIRDIREIHVRFDDVGVGRAALGEDRAEIPADLLRLPFDRLGDDAAVGGIKTALPGGEDEITGDLAL